MALAEVAADGMRISVETSFMEKDLVKACPGARWDPETKMWHTPLSWGACLALRGLFADRLQVGEALSRWAYEERRRRIDPANEIRHATHWAGGVVLEPDMYPFQDVGAEFLVRARRALLADEMGTGKTIQAIRALRRLRYWYEEQPYPALVISPNTAKQAWLNEWRCWDPNTEVFVVRGSATQRRKILEEVREAASYGRNVAAVINIEAVRLHSRLAPYGNVRLSEDEKTPKELNEIEWRSVIVDEAHRIKDPRSKQTRACWQVLHGPTVEFRYALTGTPVANHVGELWSIMHGVAPEDYPTNTTYIDRYCMQSWDPFGDLVIIGVRPDTAGEFYSILNPRMRCMPKELVLPFLPKKVRPVRYVEMGPKQKKAYADIKKDMFTVLDDQALLMTSNPMVKWLRLLQFASSYATVEGDEVRLMEPSPKLDAMEEIIDELDGASVVVVAESRQLIDMAAARLDKRKISYRMITGTVPDIERQGNIDDFQAGRAQVMLMTIKAGGVGITLTKAGVIVFLQRSWSMVDNKQCEDRVHRIGSEIHDKIVVVDLVTVGTVEEEQIPRLHDKLRRLEEIVRHREVCLANGDLAAVAQIDAEVAALESAPLWQDISLTEEAA